MHTGNNDGLVARASAAVLLVSLVISTSASSAEIDPDSGLTVADGWETVRANCTACHSAKFITFQRGDRDTWESMIRWMQKTQGLWLFDKKTEDTILSYLAANYPPGKSSRRRNLSPAELPID
jgi:cytochrome c5|tara:strand:+ start:503 stop:871 length:369 start_codon:yes stop_codon:yes gene_type:complete